MKAYRVCVVIAALSVLLCFNSFAADPVILSQPQNYYFPANTEFPAVARFSVLASGEGLTYQWQNGNSSGNFYNSSAAGYNTPNFTPTVQDSQLGGNRLYRCVITSSDGQVVSTVVTVSVGAFRLNSIPQLLNWLTQIGGSIFDTVGLAAGAIVSTPLLLIGVSFFALGASIAVLSRLLSRS